MRRLLPAIATLLLSTSSAFGDLIERFWREPDGSRRSEIIEDFPIGPAVGLHAYDNWRGPSRGGVSLFPRGVSEFPIGTAEIGDDLQLITSGPAEVNDIGFSYMNASATSVITHFRSTVRFYNQDLQLVGTDEFDHNLALQPGIRVATFTDSNFYRGYHIPVSSLMYMSVQFTNIVGAGPGDMGMLVGGPITTGNSSQYLRSMGTGELIDLGTSTQRNLAFFIDTVSVPSPSAITALAAAFSFTLRRRR